MAEEVTFLRKRNPVECKWLHSKPLPDAFLPGDT